MQKSKDEDVIFQLKYYDGSQVVSEELHGLFTTCGDFTYKILSSDKKLVKEIPIELLISLTKKEAKVVPARQNNQKNLPSDSKVHYLLRGSDGES